MTRTEYEDTNASRTLDQDRLDEILALTQAQAMDDGDLSGISSWGPIDQVRREDDVSTFLPGSHVKRPSDLQAYAAMIVNSSDQEIEEEEVEEEDSAPELSEDEIAAMVADRDQYNGWISKQMWQWRSGYTNPNKKPAAKTTPPPAALALVITPAEFVPASQHEDRNCCTHNRKQHYHYSCTDCGGLAPSKSKLDTGKSILCKSCWEKSRELKQIPAAAK